MHILGTTGIYFPQVQLSEVKETAFMCSEKGQKMEETAASTAAECSPNHTVAAEQLSTYIIVAGIHLQVQLIFHLSCYIT